MGLAGLIGAGVVAVPVLMVTVDGPIMAAIGTISGTFKVVVDTFAKSGDSKYSMGLLAVIYAALVAAYLADTALARARLTAWLAGATGFVFIAIAFSGILTNLIKFPVGRARPFVAELLSWPEINPFSISGDFHSFPSGHANTAFAIAVAVGFFVPALRRYLLILAVGVGLCRVLQFRHFLSDSVGGALLAVVSTLWLRVAFARYRVVFQLESDGRIRLTAPGRHLRRLVKRRIGAIRPGVVGGSGTSRPGPEAEVPGALQ